MQNRVYTAIWNVFKYGSVCLIKNNIVEIETKEFVPPICYMNFPKALNLAKLPHEICLENSKNVTFFILLQFAFSLLGKNSVTKWQSGGRQTLCQRTLTRASHKKRVALRALAPTHRVIFRDVSHYNVETHCFYKGLTFFCETLRIYCASPETHISAYIWARLWFGR